MQSVKGTTTELSKGITIFKKTENGMLVRDL